MWMECAIKRERAKRLYHEKHGHNFKSTWTFAHNITGQAHNQNRKEVSYIRWTVPSYTHVASVKNGASYLS